MSNNSHLYEIWQCLFFFFSVIRGHHSTIDSLVQAAQVFAMIAFISAPLRFSCFALQQTASLVQNMLCYLFHG